MVSNFEILMDFKNARDFAICMSKNNICCHKANCFVKVAPEQVEKECRRCWLDFLTSDEGLDLSYLEAKQKFNAISTGVDEYIMRLEEENRKLRDKNEALERYAELCRFSDLEEEETEK